MTHQADNHELAARTGSAAGMAIEAATVIGTVGGAAYAAKLAQNAADATTNMLTRPKAEKPHIELPPGVERK